MLLHSTKFANKTASSLSHTTLAPICPLHRPRRPFPAPSPPPPTPPPPPPPESTWSLPRSAMVWRVSPVGCKGCGAISGVVQEVSRNVEVSCSRARGVVQCCLQDVSSNPSHLPHTCLRGRTRRSKAEQRRARWWRLGYRAEQRWCGTGQSKGGCRVQGRAKVVCVFASPAATAQWYLSALGHHATCPHKQTRNLLS